MKPTKARKHRKPAALKLRHPEPLESDIMAGTKTVLGMHRAVAWFARMNSGAGRLAHPDGKGGWRIGQFMRFAFPGCTDWVGQMVDGRFLAVECKKPSEDPDPDQEAFLQQVHRHGGVAIVVRRVDELWRELDAAARQASELPPTPMAKAELEQREADRIAALLKSSVPAVPDPELSAPTTTTPLTREEVEALVAQGRVRASSLFGSEEP